MKGRLDRRRLRIVLHEGRGSRPLDDHRRVQTLVALLEDGHPVTRLPAGLQGAAPCGPDDLVVGQFAGGAVAVLEAAGGGSRYLDITGMEPDEVRDAVRGELRETEVLPAWKPWFPVIDYDRCTNCMQCLTFCLFGVYGVDGRNQITVEQPDNCKADCPACSRVCPEAAIMFPKYKSGPINGDVVRDEDLQREAMKVDISALLGGDIHGTLRDRSSRARERFSTERDESKALLERKRCLKELQKTLDIPDEVLMTLPSAGDIEERARRAREKAARREQRSQTMRDQRAATAEEWDI
jgi:NAD-dependent dihydropyrimidine dehydrogenase PreA subunit